MAVINYAEQYQRALANAYPKVLYFGDLWNPTNTQGKYILDPTNAKKVKIPYLTTTGRVAGDRATVGSYTEQRFSNDWQEVELTNHRVWDTFVHPQDINQTNMVLTIQNITKTFNEQQKFFEMDCYLCSKIFSDWKKQSGTADETVLTADNILATIDKMMEAMDEAEVPDSGRFLYCTSAVNTLLKNAMQRFLSATDASVTRTIRRIDDLVIKHVPSSRMKSEYVFTKGAVASETADQINFFIVHPSVILPISNYSFVGMSEPSATSRGKYLYYEESFEDVFTLNTRKDALAYNITKHVD